jgi:hypothetical protein
MDLNDIIFKFTDQKQGLQLRQGVVTATAAGSCSVAISGSSSSITLVKYLASYTPTTNDKVFMLIDGKDVLILGKLG